MPITVLGDPRQGPLAIWPMPTMPTDAPHDARGAQENLMALRGALQGGAKPVD